VRTPDVAPFDEACQKVLEKLQVAINEEQELVLQGPMPVFDLARGGRFPYPGQDVPYAELLAHRCEGAHPALHGMELHTVIREDLARPPSPRPGPPPP